MVEVSVKEIHRKARGIVAIIKEDSEAIGKSVETIGNFRTRKVHKAFCADGNHGFIKDPLKKGMCKEKKRL